MVVLDLNSKVKPIEIQKYGSSHTPLVGEKNLRDESKELLLRSLGNHATGTALNKRINEQKKTNDHVLSMDNVCNRRLFSFPSKVEMAEERKYLRN